MRAKVVLLASGKIGLAVGLALAESKHELIAVVSPPAKPAGRGRTLCLCPTGNWVTNSKIPCLMTKSVRKDEEIKNKIKSLKPDVLIVADFGQIIPNDLIDLPKYGCINVHPSLLPKYRGAAPINWPIINGDKITGVSIMYLTEELDAGDVILQQKVEIENDEDAKNLEERLAKIGGEMLVQTIDQLLNGTAKRTKQNENEVTWAHKLSKEDGSIDWNLNANDIINRIRGLAPWPGTYTKRNGKLLHIKKAKLSNENGKPGEVLNAKRKLIVGCGKNSIEVLSIQPEGKKTMEASSYVNGYRVNIGEIWGDK